MKDQLMSRPIFILIRRRAFQASTLWQRRNRIDKASGGEQVSEPKYNLQTLNRFSQFCLIRRRAFQAAMLGITYSTKFLAMNFSSN